MNEYEKALMSISAMFIDVIIKDDVYGVHYSTEHLYNTETYKKNKQHFDTLQHLVDTTNPTKPDIYIGEYVGENVGLNYGLHEHCGNCTQIEFSDEMNYCSNCGVKIDRGKEDE